MAKITELEDVVAPTGSEPVIIISGGRAKRTRFDRIAQPFVNAAQAARDKALNWADAAEDMPVEPGKFSARHWAAKALAVFNTGASQVALAVSSAAAAATSAAAALASQVASATNAGLALGARNTAVAAAEASGNIKFYDTKQAAINAFAPLPDLQIIEVLADESRGKQVTRYRKEGGAYAFKRYMPSTSVIYVDSKFGSDANDGLTADTPLQTITAAITLVGGFSGLGAGRPYTTFALARGSEFFSPFTNAAEVPWSRFDSYGQGEKPIVNMTTSPFTPGAWINHPTYTNCWYQDVDMLGPQGNAYLPSGWVPQANMWHLNAWDRAVPVNTGLDGFDTTSRLSDSYMQRVLNGDPIPDGNFDPDTPFTTSIAIASQNAIYAYVDAWANTITAFPLNGDNGQNWEPRNGTASRMRIVIHPRDNTNPNTNGRTVRITDFKTGFVLGRGMDVNSLTFACNGGKDMVSGYQTILNNGVPGPADVRNIGSGNFTNVDFIEHACHGPVVCGMSGEDINCLGSYMRTAVKYNGGSLHNFRSNNGDQHSRGYTWKNVRAKRGGYVIYSHGNGNSNSVEHRKSDLLNAVIEDCNGIMIGGTTLQGSVCENVYAKGVNTLAGVPNVTFINSEISSRPGIDFVMGAVGDAGRMKFIKTLVDASQANSISLPTARAGAEVVASSLYPIVDLVDSTIFGTFSAQSALRNQTKLRLRRSYIGVFDALLPNEVGILGNLDSDAVSVIGCARTSPETLRATFPNLPVGVETGIKRQTWTRTLVASDFAFQPVANTFNATTYVDNGDGTANITTSFNFGSANTSRYIKIVGANASGADYYGRLVANVDNGTLKISPVPTGASTSSNKAVTFGLLRPKLYRNAVSAWISSDGLTLLLADNSLEVQGIAAGMIMNVSSPVPNVPAPGIREVQAVATTNVTFTGSITTTTLTVTAISSGAIVPGVIQSGAAAGTKILSQITSTEAQAQLGGLGTYLVDASQTVAAGTAMTCQPLVKLTLTKPITWLQKTSGSSLLPYRSIATPTSGTGRGLKTVSITWGFQMQQNFLAGCTQPQIGVTFAEGGGFTITQARSGAGGGFGIILSGALGTAQLGFDSNMGTTGALAYNVIDHENGWWNQGLGLYPGDTLTITTEHEILPWRLAHTSPYELGGYSPVPTSLVAQRSIGYRPSRAV